MNWLTTAEAAAVLRVSAATVREMVRAKAIPAYPMGSGTKPRLRFRRDELDSYLEGQRTIARSAPASAPRPKADRYVPRFDHGLGGSSPRTLPKDSRR